MSKANEIQVGGNHYARGGRLQHWDYAVRALGNRYLEGAITKYVMRHRHKGIGEQDLMKALHFTDKLLEEHAANRIHPLRTPHDYTFSVHELSVANALNVDEDFIVKRLASWEHVDHLFEVRNRIKSLLDVERERLRQREAIQAGAKLDGMARTGEVPANL